MKLIICILQDSDKDKVVKALNSNNYRVTVLASTGGYFRSGNTTLMIGVEKERLDEAIELIRDHCAPPRTEGMRRATLFVLNVDQFEKL
jgi:uncharacterized protein YaaQ